MGIENANGLVNFDDCRSRKLTSMLILQCLQFYKTLHLQAKQREDISQSNCSRKIFNNKATCDNKQVLRHGMFDFSQQLKTMETRKTLTIVFSRFIFKSR